MSKNPYYLVLRAVNFQEKLTLRQEKQLGSAPTACLLYAKKVLKGRLPDHLHNRMVLEVWKDKEDQEVVSEYLKNFGNT